MAEKYGGMMTELSGIAKIKRTLEFAKQHDLGCDLRYFDVIELLGHITALEETIQLNDEMYKNLWEVYQTEHARAITLNEKLKFSEAMRSDNSGEEIEEG